MRFVVLLLAAGCTAGLGPSTAATRPLIGQTMSNNDAMMWAPAADQSNVPYGFTRMVYVHDSLARAFNWVSITSSLRSGSSTPKVAGVEQKSKGVLDLDLAVTVRIPLPFGGISIGGGRSFDIEDKADLSGWGVRASVAPVPQLSFDFARSWGDGTLDTGTGTMTDISGTHTSLGATVLVWGYNQYRFGIAVAKTWTDADPYSSSGYTYTLVSTMY